MKHEDGFHFLEYPCASGTPDGLVLILHGHDNHPNMFTKLAEEIQKQRPNTDVLLVRGPVAMNATKAKIRANGAGDADDLYTWHHVTKNAGENAKLVLSHFFNRVPVVDQLNTFADAQLAKRGLKDENLALFGFSLGGAIAVQMGTRRPNEVAAVVNHSGPVFPVGKAQSKPETLFVMGDKDDFFYTDKMEIDPPKNKIKKVFNEAVSKVSLQYHDSMKRLQGAKIPVQGAVIPGMGHTVNENSFRPAMTFMHKRLKK